MFYVLAWLFCSALLKMAYGFRSYGRRNVPATGGVILAINHQSFIDPVAAGCGIGRPVHFMARATLFGGPFGVLIGNLNAFPVSRGHGDVKALKEYIARAKAGNVVMLFPEGTRSKDGRLQKLEPGVGMLAVRAGVPVVPTYVEGSFRAWSRHMLLPGRGDVSIYYDKPISVERMPDETKRQHRERIRDTIAERIARLASHCESKRRRFAPKRRDVPAAGA